MAEQSLAHSVAWRVEQFRKQTGVSVELTVAPAWDEASLSRAARAHILRAVDAALANTREHAAARSIRVSLAVESGQAVMRVEDDGAGFLLCRLVGKLLSPAQQRSSLCHLRDRTRALGGTFEIASSPGKGTRLGVKIPPMSEETQTTAGLPAADRLPGTPACHESRAQSRPARVSALGGLGGFG